MIINYNTLNRMEMPRFVLCNPGCVYHNGRLSNVVGVLIDHEAEEIVFNFNATSELNMRVNRVHRPGQKDDEFAYELFKKIQNRRLIYVDDIGFFMITNVENGYDGEKQYKDIKAQSIDIEIEQKMIPFIPDGTYKLFPVPTNPGGMELSDNSESENEEEADDDEEETAPASQDTILEIIVRSLPLWTVGHIDEAVLSKWRTFNDVDVNTNCLSFLVNDVQNAYECIVLFDIISRTINIYDQAGYIRPTSIHITREDVINELNVTENADSIYTAIRVMGDDNVTISAINPIGGNVIYDFSYYYSWMPSDLREKVMMWQSAVEAAKESYYNTNLQYYEKLSVATNYQLEIQRLNIQASMYQRCRDNIIAEASTALVDSYNTVIIENGGTPIEVYEEIADTIAHIDELLAACLADEAAAEAALDVINDEIANIKTVINETRERLSLSSRAEDEGGYEGEVSEDGPFFTDEDYQELQHYIFEGAYTDDYVIITDSMTYNDQFAQMKILYDRAVVQLEKVSRPTQEFSVSAENFIFAKEFSHWSDELETGVLISVEIEEGDVAQLFLTSITMNYDDRSLSLTFGNRYNRFDPKSLFEDVLGNVSKSANTIDYIKDIISPMTNGEFNAMREAIQSSRNLTMGAALASSGEEVIIDGSGYTGRKLLDNGTYDPHQVKLTGKSLVFTDDAWESCKVAVGELLSENDGDAYGINAEAIIGNIIMGNNLRIVDNSGNDLLTVIDGKISAQVSELDGRIASLQQNADGIFIRIQALEEASGEVDHVTTTTGYTFNADGLTIYRSGEEIKNLLDNTGMYVTRSGEEVLTANNEGVAAINLTARQYLIVGENSRFEDYNNGVDAKRTACFFMN